MDKLLYFSFIILIFGTKWSHVDSQLQIDDPCIVQSNRAPGTCAVISKCISAIQGLRQGKRPTVCGYQGAMQIVCCQNPPPPTTTERPISKSCYETIRHKKCVEYSDAVYEITERIRLSNGTIYNRKLDKCGHIAIPLIVGGTPALPKEFPHSAQLGYQMVADDPISWDCGGALISERYVVTAGHCLRSAEKGDVKLVKLGDLNTATELDDARPETFRVETIIPHPEYTRAKLYNDIALLRLDRQVVFNPYVRPLCLPLVNVTTTEKAIATGWGFTDWAGESSNSLLKVTLDLYTHNECNLSYVYSINRKMPQGIIEETQLCAGSRNSSRDTCQGDSGGPLQIYHKNIYCMYTLFGVTSFGRACGTANTPGVYTRVAAYVDWIESVVWPTENTVHVCEQL